MSPHVPWAASVEIAGTGVAFPTCVGPQGERLDRIETSMLLKALAPELPEARREALLAHVESTVGIRARAWSRWLGAEPQADEADGASLAREAAERALAQAGVHASELAAIVVGTSTPPRWTSPIAASLAGGLGMQGAFFDVRSGCAGGLYALALASSFAQQSQRPTLAVGVDTFSKALPRNERLLSLVTGDGAGALVLAPAPAGKGIVHGVFGGNGAHHKLVSVDARLPPKGDEGWTLQGDPERFAAEAEAALSLVLSQALQAAPRSPALHLIHSAQRSTLLRVAERVGASPESVWLPSLEQHGNLGAASIPAALHESRAAGRFASGTLAALASVGGGLSWGALLWQA